jgi:lipopolysaccharide assembly protein A
MRVLYWAAVAVAAVVLMLFAVSNRGAVSLGLWPLPFGVELPLYLLALGALFAGFLIGVIGGWLAGHGRRVELRRSRRRIAALERELATTQAQLDNRPEPSPARIEASR